MTTYSYYENGVRLATGLSQSSVHRQCDLGGGTAVPEVSKTNPRLVPTLNAKQTVQHQDDWNRREMNARAEREKKALASGALKAFKKWVMPELRGVK